MRERSGYLSAIGAYLWWGLFPFYFTLLNQVNPMEIIPWRVLFTLAMCVIVIAIARAWRPVLAILRNRRALGWLALSALLLYANWQIFVTGVISGNVLETSLGYFINPLVTILLGVLVRKEKLRPAQWVAVAIAGVAVIVLTVLYGQPPWLALGLAFSFGLYGFVKKQASADIDALSGLAVETLAVLPVAVLQLVIVGVTAGGLNGFSHGTATSLLLLASGCVTAVPLLLFAAANRRLPLVHIGFIQFLTPILGFLYGFFVMGEEMPPERWIGFALVWVALVILIVDMVRGMRAAPRGDRA